MNVQNTVWVAVVLSLTALGLQTADAAAPQHVTLAPKARVVLMGGGLASRMQHFGHFETGMHLRFSDHQLYIRNMADEGNTPSFRPHSGRAHQLGFPGAEKFAMAYCEGNTANGNGHFETEEQWLARLQPDVLIVFFGFSESFQGKRGIDNFRAELDAFVKHTLSQKYNGKAAPQLVLVSPTAYEDRTDTLDVPNGQIENANLAAYTAVMETVAAGNGVLFVNAFAPSVKWYETSNEPLTTDGALLNDAGYRALATLLIERIFGAGPSPAERHRDKVHAAVADKNWLWTNDFKIPNGVHVFGRRHNPFGPENYPFEVEKIRQMTAIRDQAIWAAATGQSLDVAALDANTAALPEVKTNYQPSNKNGQLVFLKGKEALDTIKAPEGYKIEQWATEQEFPELANPVQMSFDNKGRLWVATMPSYPHWRPADPRPDDKLLILEDTDGDGKADRQTVFADNLHLPMGFEIAADGVYVSQGIHLIRLRDTDGDDHADVREIIFSGFDDHDTHHAIGAFCADESGAIIMCEGVFLRSNIETAYGPVRGTNGGFYRFDPVRRHLERHAQLSIPNPWGVAFDAWGQHFFLHTSGTPMEWMLPGTVKPRYAVANPKSADLIEQAHRVRPTSGLEFMSSRHFPDEVQGDIMLNNTIGFLGTKQHQILEDGTGYKTRHRQDLINSTDGNFRPVDMEIAPDGSLYVVDWHNPLIGHMQHNARDPNRDHAHGRIYRVTYPSRPLLEPAKIDGAPIELLLENLKLPEYRTRYRTRRELRGRNADEVIPAVKKWVASLDKHDPQREHHMLEALWVTWGLNRIDEDMLRQLLKSGDHRVRAAAVRVLRYNGHKVADQVELLKHAAADPHGRVKLEAITAASWLGKSNGLAVLDATIDRVDKPETSKADHVKVSASGGMIHITPPPAARDPITGFTITLPGDKRTINLAEMQIIAGGKNVTKQAIISQSSDYNAQYRIANLTDGNKGNFSHTSFESNPSITVRFAAPAAIDDIRIWNRSGFEERFDNANVAFLNGKQELAAVKVRVAAGGEAPFGNDPWIAPVYKTALAHLQGQAIVEEEHKVAIPPHLKGKARDLFVKGTEIYSREGFCGTCHQLDGKGLVHAGFPPLANSPWVTQQDERLIKLTLNGLMGPIEVNGVQYPGLVPMTPFAGMLKDDEIAAVLTYVRNSFGNKAPVISPEQVKLVREATKDKVGFYTPAELLQMQPHP